MHMSTSMRAGRGGALEPLHGALPLGHGLHLRGGRAVRRQGGRIGCDEAVQGIVQAAAGQSSWVCMPTECSCAQDAEGRWNRFTGRYPWDPGCICAGDAQYGGTGAPKEGSCFGAAPNVDHSNERVRQVRRPSAYCLIAYQMEVSNVDHSNERVWQVRGRLPQRYPTAVWWTLASGLFSRMG